MARPTRMALDLALLAAKTIKPVVATSWKYAKVEVVPPLTINFFNGPAGKKLEQTVGGVGNGVINFLERSIREIDNAALRKVKEQEARVEAERKAQMAKAEAKKKEEAAKKAKMPSDSDKKAETKALAVTAPAAKAPAAKAPDVKAPAAKAPDVKAPAAKAPDAKAKPPEQKK